MSKQKQTQKQNAMKKPATFTITKAESLEEWENTNNATRNGIVLIVENVEKIYLQLDWLCRACAKQYKKFGGLDLGYLSESSSLKAITREARTQGREWGEAYTMEDDRTARKYLAARILEYCAAI